MRKLLSIIRWVLVMLVNLLGFITAPFIFPIAYVFRNTKLKKIFWIYYDDEDGFNGTQWFLEAKDLEPNTFKTAYLWCAIRNPAWNLQASLKPKEGEIKIIKSKGELTQDGSLISILNFAVLKYVDITGDYKDNKGDYLSLKHSRLGNSFVWYEIDGTLYWRKSIAKKVGPLWFELQLGTNDDRYTYRAKLKAKIEIFENLEL